MSRCITFSINGEVHSYLLVSIDFVVKRPWISLNGVAQEDIVDGTSGCPGRHKVDNFNPTPHLVLIHDGLGFDPGVLQNSDLVHRGQK